MLQMSPDVLLEISVNSCSNFEFYKPKNQIEMGRQICRRALATLADF